MEQTSHVRNHTVTLFVRRDCLTLSLSGKIVAATLTVSLAVCLFYGVYPFLAVNSPSRGDFLIVEGWTIPYEGVLRQTATEYHSGHYRGILIVQESCRSRYSESEPYCSCPDAQNILSSYGIPDNVIASVDYAPVTLDRTYHAAIEARDWLRQHHIAIRSVDVITIGPHARRSRSTFQKAFGNGAGVGIIALPDPQYDSQHWWRTSEGFKEVQAEAIAYIYARFHLLWLG
jgi:uncharacterized SAM-binding protein YcdF (DUF218 family)